MKKKIISLFLLLGALILSGCTIGVGPTEEKVPVNGGIYKSTDQGNERTQSVGVTGFPRPGSLNTISILGMYFDPNDLKTIYLATEGSGLFQSHNSGEVWMQTVGLTKGVIKSLAIDPKSKCTLYAATNENVTILKTTDCGRNWERIHYTTVPGETLTALAVPSANSNIIYAGSSLGYIYKSIDYGASWQRLNVKPLGNTIVKFLIDPRDNNIIYVPTERKGIFKTTDAGLTGWDKQLAFTCDGADTNCKNNFLPASNFVYRTLIFNPIKPHSLIYASDYGIIKTENGGELWQTLTLLNPTGKVIIQGLAVVPDNDNELYYVTNTTFYRSVDSGKNWSTRKLPTTLPPTALTIDPLDYKKLYLTLRIPPQK